MTDVGVVRARLVRRAELLVGGTLAYNALEAGVALWAGGRADSIALVGFGLDSLIELAAGAVVLWRMRVEAGGASAARLEATERAVRRFVGVTFFLLAAYVTAEAAGTLWGGEPPKATAAGLVLATASLAIMPLIAWAKLRTAHGLGSRSLAAEAKETLACAYLSLCLLLGLAGNAALGWWWADPIAALAMVPWLVREGREAFDDD